MALVMEVVAGRRVVGAARVVVARAGLRVVVVVVVVVVVDDTLAASRSSAPSRRRTAKVRGAVVVVVVAAALESVTSVGRGGARIAANAGRIFAQTRLAALSRSAASVFFSQRLLSPRFATHIEFRTKYSCSR